MVIYTMVTKSMNVKFVAVMSVLAMVLAAAVFVLPATDDSDADEPTTPTYTLTYKVFYKDGTTVKDERTFIMTYTSSTATLATLKELGGTAPEGVEFSVWHYEAGNADYAAGSTFIIPTAGTATLTAHWKAIEYEATFIGYDGSVLGEPVKGPTKTVAADGVTISDATPKDLAKIAAGLKTDREGYIFIGWMVEGAEKPIATKDLGKLTATVKYTATYAVDYIVKFIDGDKTYMSHVADLIVPDVGERTGYTFVGWFVDGKQADPETYEYTKDTTFTAKWEAKNCYVTFKAGNEVIAKVPVLYGEKVVEPKLPEGFVAWDFDFSKVITEDITINAVPAEPAKPSGFDDPIVKTVVIFVVIIAIIALAFVFWKVKKGDFVIGRAKTIEEKKE